MDVPSADGEPGLHCDPIRRPLPGDGDEEYWIGELDKDYDTPLERLLTDVITIDWGDGEQERLTQQEFFELWQTIEPTLDFADTNGDEYDRKLDNRCAFCDDMMVSVPRLNHECEACGASKHDVMEMKWQLYVEEQSRPPGLREQVFDIPIHTVLFKDGISCPDGHYLCWFCIGELPDTRLLSQSDIPNDIDSPFE